MKLVPWLSVVAIVSASVSGLFYYKESLSNAQSMPSGPEQSTKVQAFRAKNVSYQKRLSVVGEGHAVRHIILKNELSGKIAKLNISSGDVVKKGQVLLELEHSEELALLVSARATKTLKQQTLARYQALAKEKRISKENVDVAQAEYQIAIADITRLEAIISKKIIVSPFDANIGIHNLSVGQFLDSNTEITDLVGIDDFIWVDFKVPQVYPQLALNSVVDVSMSSTSSLAEVSSHAIISSIAPRLTKDSRQLKYRAKVLTSAFSVKPNQLVKVAVPIVAEKSVIMVPSLAIVRDQLGEYVFKLVKDDKGGYRAKREKVTLGDRVNEQVVVSEGLLSDELVAAKGSFKLREGLKIHFDNDNMGG